MTTGSGFLPRGRDCVCLCASLTVFWSLDHLRILQPFFTLQPSFTNHGMSHPICSIQDCGRYALLTRPRCFFCGLFLCYDHDARADTHPCYGRDIIDLGKEYSARRALERLSKKTPNSVSNFTTAMRRGLYHHSVLTIGAADLVHNRF